MNPFAWRGAVMIAFLIVLALLCGPAISPDRNFTFGFNGLWAFPQDHFLTSHVLSGHWPVWNRYDSAGTSPGGNPAVGLFYPLKAVLLLRPFGAAFKIFILLHLGLAVATSYGLARRLGADGAAAGLAALAYGAGGAVLFGVTSAGGAATAAWLPVVFWAADRAAGTGRLADAVCLGLALALIYLGGDVPMACTGALAAGLYLIVLWPAAGRETSLVGYAARIGVTAAVGLLVLVTASAVQLLPAWELARRGAEAHGREALGWLDGLFHPWRLLELAWPNVLGIPWPVHRHWGQALIGQPGWTPSLYMGAAPAVMAVAAVAGLRHARTLAFVLLAVGACLLASSPTIGSWGPLFLPGAFLPVSPSRWLLLASLAIAMLAARGSQAFLDRLGLGSDPHRRAWRGPAFAVAVLYAAVSLSAAVGLAVAGHSLLSLLPLEDVEETFMGPFLEGSVLGTVRLAVIQGSAVGLVLVLMGLMAARGLAGRRLLCSVLWVVTAWDLVLANRWMVVTCPSAPPVSSRTEAESPLERRLYPGRGALPESFFMEVSPERIEAWSRFQQTRLAGHWNLYRNPPVPSWQTPGVPLVRYGVEPACLEMAGGRASAEAQDDPCASFYTRIGQGAPADGSTDTGLFPRAWLVPRARYYASEEELRAALASSPATRVQGTAPAPPLDLTSEVGLRDAPAGWADHGSLRLKFGRPRVVVQDGPPGRLTATFQGLEADGFLVLSERYDPGWKAEAWPVRSGKDGDAQAASPAEPRPVLRANAILMAVPIRATDGRVHLHFQSKWLLWGLGLSAISWANAILVLALCGRRSRPAKADRAEAPHPPDHPPTSQASTTQRR